MQIRCSASLPSLFQKRRGLGKYFFGLVFQKMLLCFTDGHQKPSNSDNAITWYELVISFAGPSCIGAWGHCGDVGTTLGRWERLCWCRTRGAMCCIHSPLFSWYCCKMILKDFKGNSPFHSAILVFFAYGLSCLLWSSIFFLGTVLSIEFAMLRSPRLSLNIPCA